MLHPVGLDVHLPSTVFDPAASPALARFLDHVEVVVTVHGYGRRERWTTPARRRVRTGTWPPTSPSHLRPALPDYEVVTDLEDMPSGLRGLHPDNPVNRPRGGGVQLELPPRVRGRSPLSPPAGPDGLSPPTRALIDALAAAARTWPPRPRGLTSAHAGPARQRRSSEPDRARQHASDSCTEPARGWCQEPDPIR